MDDGLSLSAFWAFSTQLAPPVLPPGCVRESGIHLERIAAMAAAVISDEPALMILCKQQLSSAPWAWWRGAKTQTWRLIAIALLYCWFWLGILVPFCYLLDFSRYFSGAMFCCFWRCCQVAILLPVPWRDYIEYLNSNAILICTRLWSRGIFVRKMAEKKRGHLSPGLVALSPLVFWKEGTAECIPYSI